ncbi:MAG TPA: diphthamide biosynthesis enzyme Dph2, partial [Hadesarchaea archaeon]|nr:diphthamide biosynthesis enzyme Dph2 [Hadesarchaea archaeon]
MLKYYLEEKSVRRFLKRYEAKRVAVQLPSGLRPKLPEILRVFEEMGVEPVIIGESCYGGCDLGDAEARRMGCDVLIHYGHADMGLKTCLPTLYVEARMPVDPADAIESALPQLDFKRVGLITTVQHISYLHDVAELLRTHGFEPFIGKPGRRAKYPGQLLGCDFGCARSVSSLVEGFLYFGTGEFHPLGAALATGKKVLAVNPVSSSSKRISPDIGDFLKRRKAVISRAAAGERFGIIVSTKSGQTRFNLATRLVKELKHAGRTASILVMNEVRPEELNDFEFDALVCTACPR